VPELFAYTDGACSGNPGPGGWGVLMLAMDGDTVLKERELCGGEMDTTNNRMELLAAISALDVLERESALTIVTDSSYVKDGLTKWIHGWKRNGWKTASKKPVKNEDNAPMSWHGKECSLISRKGYDLVDASGLIGQRLAVREPSENNLYIAAPHLVRGLLF